jgi:putative SOS response-associated peptidase YedK
MSGPGGVLFEWQKLDAKTKQTYAIALENGDLFAFAGLWETWRNKANRQVLESYLFITTDANELMEPFHDRMPAILDPQDYERRLTPAEPSHLPVGMLRPYPTEKMKAWKVGDDVGNMRNNRPELIDPI